MPASIKVIAVTGLSTDGGGYGFFAPDWTKSPFNLGLGVVLTTTASTNTYTVQHTFDYNGSSNFVANSTQGTGTSSSPYWFNHSTMVNATSNLDSNYAFPVTGIRLYVTAGASTTTTTLSIVSAG